MQNLFPIVIVSCILVLSVTITLCLIKAIIGPRLVDRIIAGNMIGVKTNAIIAMLAVLMEEWYLLDICLVYALISFLAVVVLTMIVQKPSHETLAEQLRRRHIHPNHNEQKGEITNG